MQGFTVLDDGMQATFPQCMTKYIYIGYGPYIGYGLLQSPDLDMPLTPCKSVATHAGRGTADTPLRRLLQFQWLDRKWPGVAHWKLPAHQPTPSNSRARSDRLLTDSAHGDAHTVQVPGACGWRRPGAVTCLGVSRCAWAPAAVSWAPRLPPGRTCTPSSGDRALLCAPHCPCP